MSEIRFSTAGKGTRTTISLSEFKGKRYILIQKEYKTYGSEDWHPGKATTVSLENWLEFERNVQLVTEALLVNKVLVPGE